MLLLTVHAICSKVKQRRSFISLFLARLSVFRHAHSPVSCCNIFFCPPCTHPPTHQSSHSPSPVCNPCSCCSCSRRSLLRTEPHLCVKLRSDPKRTNKSRYVNDRMGGRKEKKKVLNCPPHGAPSLPFLPERFCSFLTPFLHPATSTSSELGCNKYIVGGVAK